MARGFLLRSAAYVLLAAIAVATGVQLVMSAIQAANKPADTSTNNQLIPLTGDLTSDNACQTSVLNQSRPLEVIVMDKNTGKNSTLYCGWPSGNEAVRLPTAVVSLVLAVCVLVFGMWKRKRCVRLFFCLYFFLCGGMGLETLVIGNHLARRSFFCFTFRPTETDAQVFVVVLVRLRYVGFAFVSL